MKSGDIIYFICYGFLVIIFLWNLITRKNIKKSFFAITVFTLATFFMYDGMTYIRNTATNVMSIITPERPIKQNATTFLEAFVQQDIDTMMEYTDPGPGLNQTSARESLIAASNLITKINAINQYFNGAPTKITHIISDIEIIDKEHASVTYYLTSGANSDTLVVTFVKVKDKWKLYLPSFMSQLIFS